MIWISQEVNLGCCKVVIVRLKQGGLHGVVESCSMLVHGGWGMVM